MTIHFFYVKHNNVIQYASRPFLHFEACVQARKITEESFSDSNYTCSHIISRMPYTDKQYEGW